MRTAVQLSALQADAHATVAEQHFALKPVTHSCCWCCVLQSVDNITCSASVDKDSFPLLYMHGSKHWLDNVLLDIAA